MSGEDLIRHGFAVPPSPTGEGFGLARLPDKSEFSNIIPYRFPKHNSPPRLARRAVGWVDHSAATLMVTGMRVVITVSPAVSLTVVTTIAS